MADRFYVSEPIVSDRVTLGGEEAHHLIHVLRAKTGQVVTLFDGGGGEFAARIERIGRTGVELAVEFRREVDRELPCELTLAVALPKGDRQRWLIEKAVELGVWRLVPLETERSVAEPVDKALQRMRRIVIEASKQCGRNRLMEIASPRDWSPWCAEAGSIRVTDLSRRRAMADPSGGVGTREWTESLRTGPTVRSVLLAVGPEGGWTEAELAVASTHGWQVLNLGPRILRVETAAVTLAAFFSLEG
ncbi:MAG TPA: 16S rRNA (uracil(1498)-N(3))-methyltransferase [Pirellulales bacterium]|nr:16S rRNA (uracil(1498)-N(3))-methyltransferase [Pirellulales bacterium]